MSASPLGFPGYYGVGERQTAKRADRIREVLAGPLPAAIGQYVLEADPG